MQVEFLGANCLRFKAGGVTLVFDDNLKALSGKGVARGGDIVCITNRQLIDQPTAARIVLDTPGNYEVSDILIDGIRADAFMESKIGMQSTIYKIVCNNINLAVLGHIKPGLSDDQLEVLGLIDVLFVPVGGNGYTLDATGALEITKSINPKLVIPTHYQQPGLNFEVPQDTYDKFAEIVASDAEFIKGSLKLRKNSLSEQLSLKILQTV